MQNSTPHNNVSFGKLLCNTFGHNYRLSKKITNNISEYRCNCCGEEVTENLQGYLETLTPKVKEINNCLSEFFQKKRMRKSYSEAS